MKDALLLTLGHGSSAILIRDGEIINGYQNERISRIKSDSRFPALAIEEILKYDRPENCDILISHWHPSGSLHQMSEKHYDPKYLARNFPNSPIFSTGGQITHHDAHAFSALAYNPWMAFDSHVMVMDGFGNSGEVLSIYKCTTTGLKLIRRARGYDGSLGLLYQYATDYVGLKMNQDEWKLNALAQSVDIKWIPKLNAYSDGLAIDILNSQKVFTLGRDDDPVVSLGALSHTHKKVFDNLSRILKPEQKAEVAYLMQETIQKVVKSWIDEFNIQNLTVVGGCFLNVQLNGFIRNLIAGRFCAMPLSGDEGAALGLYKYLHPNFRIPDNLCWGKRNLCVGDLSEFASIKDLAFTTNLRDDVIDALRQNKIVNVVRGDMEYGPRAYCNTSTLALPTKENKEYINWLNNRDQHMPMCPVIGADQMEQYFEYAGDIDRSTPHMILTLKFNVPVSLPSIEGVAHKMLDGSYTGRPQVVDRDHWIYPAVKILGPLINTSFNNHGQPICFDMKSVTECHKNMLENDIQNRVITFIEVSE